MKRIALITDGIWPYVLGGMQKHSYYLCKYFAAKGVHVDLFHFNHSNYDPEKLEFFTENERAFIHATIVDMPSSLKFPGHYLYNSYRHSRLIYDQLRSKLSDYDFIYTKGLTGWYLINQKFAGKIKCCDIGVKFHGYEMFQVLPGGVPGIKSSLFRSPVKKLSKRADVVFSYGGKITEIIRSLGVDAKKIVEIPSGIEKELIVDTPKNTNAKKRFVFMGRYERRKGVEELSEALVELCSNEKNFEFHFIGPIPDAKKINDERIIYHGEIRDRTTLLNKLRDCDVLVCPSYSEGFPNVILEAMGNGLAVAATPVGAVELLVDDTVGWMIKDPSPANILKILQTIIAEENIQLDAKKQNALNRIREKFTWDHIITELIAKIS